MNVKEDHMIRGIAIPIKEQEPSRPGQDMKTYLVLPPIIWKRHLSFFVNVSAVDLPVLSSFSPSCETFIFPATSDGQIIDWGEMPGSRSNVKDHDLVLRNAGRKIIMKGD